MTLRLLTAGESHGPELTCIVDGLPAGMPVDSARLDAQLDRRQRGAGAGARMRIEADAVEITAGVVDGVTIGAPVSMRLINRDRPRWVGREIPSTSVPRPGHADLAGALKYGFADLRLVSERASARETAARVAGASLGRILLEELGVKLGGYVVALGGDELPLPLTADHAELLGRASRASEHETGCPQLERQDAWAQRVADARRLGETVGGVIEVFAVDIPAGVGTYAQWDRRLDGRLAQALTSIPSVKAVAIGAGIEVAGLPGSGAHDIVVLDDRALRRPTNLAGGIEGGITNGAPVVARVWLKPIATTANGQPSVDLATGQMVAAPYERSDVCHVPRAIPIVEAMLAWVLADALLDATGGDRFDDVRARAAQLPRPNLDDARVDALPVHLRYPVSDARLHPKRAPRRKTPPDDSGEGA